MGRPKKRQHFESDDADVSETVPRREIPQSRSYTVDYNRGYYAAGGLDQMLDPNGELPPWLAQRAANWQNVLMGGGYDQSHNGWSSLPALTPDRASHSPPSLALPNEQPSENQSLDGGLGDYRNIGVNGLFDPLLPGATLGHASDMIPKCACLSSIYLTLSTLTNMDRSIGFPGSLQPLRESILTASTVIACQECPKQFITGIQNVHLLGTLLVSIAERFSKVLNHITNEANRAELAGETKKFRFADLDTSMQPERLGCNTGFNLTLNPQEWRRMCKQVVRAEVLGPTDDNDDDESRLYFLSVVKQMQERQERFHRNGPPPDCPRDEKGEFIGGPRTIAEKDGHLCLKMVGYAEKFVKGFDWS